MAWEKIGQFGGGPGGSSLQPREQHITSSQTWVPPAALLAAGGWVWVLAVGGGGGGRSQLGNFLYGGSGGAVIERLVQVTGNVTCTIGSAGTTGGSPTAGGTTSFGSLVVADGGNPGATSGPGQPAGIGSGTGGVYNTNNASPYFLAPGDGLYGYGASLMRNAGAAPANSGWGGMSPDQPAAGRIILRWWE